MKPEKFPLQRFLLLLAPAVVVLVVAIYLQARLHIRAREFRYSAAPAAEKR